MERTLWDDDGALVWPHERVAAIRGAIETELRGQLTRTQVARLSDGRSLERPSMYVHATVISLTPDIAIATVAEVPIDSTRVPFDDWPCMVLRHDDPNDRRAFNSEYINCYNGNLSLYAGAILPYTDEMYAVFVGKETEIQRIQFGDQDANVVFGNASVTLIRNGADVHVRVRYR